MKVDGFEKMATLKVEGLWNGSFVAPPELQDPDGNDLSIYLPDKLGACIFESAKWGQRGANQANH